MDNPENTTSVFQLSDGKELEIATTQYKRVDVVKMNGRIDTYTAPFLQQVLDSLTENGRFNIVLNMADIDFLSSKGLWVLTETQKKCKKLNRGELILAHVSPRISSSFDLVGMSGYFREFDDLLKAVASL